MEVHANLAGEEFPHHIKFQGQMSEWAQNKFHEHKHRTLKWKANKIQATEYKVVVRSGAESGWVSTTWQMNKNANVSYVTISVYDITPALCLEYNVSDPNTTVGVSDCYPSENPVTNRDKTQQWVWGNDATVRPYANSTLCLTTYVLEGDYGMYLRPCRMVNVEQHFGWSGAYSWLGPVEGHGTGSIQVGPLSAGVIKA